MNVRKRVLLVEQDPHVKKEIEDYFSNLSIEVIAFENEDVAFSWAGKNIVELVLVAEFFPKGSGIHFIQKLRQRSYYDQVPLYLLVESLHSSIKEKVISVGGNGCIQKKLLIETVTKIFEEQEENQKNEDTQNVFVPLEQKKFSFVVCWGFLYLFFFTVSVVLWQTLSFSTLPWEKKIFWGSFLISSFIFLSLFCYFCQQREKQWNFLFQEHQQKLQEYDKIQNSLAYSLYSHKEGKDAQELFFVYLSHKIRTTLNTIIGFNFCLLEGMSGPLTETQKENLQVIGHASEYLLEFMNDVLEFLALESGQVKLNFQRVDIIALARECQKEIEPEARKKGLDFQTLFFLEEYLLPIDTEKIRRVFWILLENALKFTREGNISISIQKEEKEVAVTILDTGIGMSSYELKSIFQPFFQGKDNLVEQYAGGGLGLTLAKHYIEMHGGLIKIHSEKEKGTSCTFTLPT